MGDWRGVRCRVTAGKAQEWCRPGEGAFQHGRAVYCATVPLCHCPGVCPLGRRPLRKRGEGPSRSQEGMATTDEPDAAFSPKEIG
jgi:hypothetical protein